MMFTMLVVGAITYITVKDSEKEVISNANTISEYVKNLKNYESWILEILA